MLKYIGVALIVLGLSLFIYLLIKGRRTGIRNDLKELKMISDAGYVSERIAEEKKASPFEGQSPIKKPKKKKRVLSEEARGILEQVEKDRGKKESPAENPKRQKENAAPVPKKGTAVLQGQPAPQTKRGTAVLPESPKRGTETLPERKSSTDVLQDKAKKGTAVLADSPARAGTAVLNASHEEEKPKGTAVLSEASPVKKNGTAVLLEEGLPQKPGTAVLNEEGRTGGTAVLPDQGKGRSGTAVLEDIPKKKGTDVLV